MSILNTTSEKDAIPLTTSKFNWLVGLFVALLIFIADQISKLLVLQHISPSEIITVWPGFFNLILTYNPGVAFGMFSQLDPNLRIIILTIVTLIAFAVIGYLYLKPYRDDRLARVALAMVVGGALGNITDRFLYGAVVDFLDFYIDNYHWPAFNIADSAICIGVVILLFRNPTEPAVKQPD